MAAKRTLKLSKSLCDRASDQAKQSGYSSVEEFIEHILERALARGDEAASREEMEKMLRGLGYLE